MDNVKRAIARLLLDVSDDHVPLKDLYNRLSAEGFPRQVVQLALEEMGQPVANLVNYGLVGPVEAMFPTHRLLPWYEAGRKQEVGNAAQGDVEAEPAKPTDPTSKSEQRAEWLAKAMLLVQDHPDWSDTEIARKVGKYKSTLSRNKTYRVAAAMARSAKGDRPEGHHTVDPDTGQLGVEAVDNNKHGDRGQPIKGSKYYREYCAECDEPIKVASDEVGENPRCKDCEK
jgi:hypothetical protein